MISRKNNASQNAETKAQIRKTIGSQLNFAAAEAYKLLRTNLLYTLADSEDICKVVGITSALRSEGKSTTSLNLAYSLSETGKRVLLLEMDMRIPCVAKRLSLHSKPGLSDILIGGVADERMIQKSTYTGNLDVIVAGDIPPNPSELLGSKRMARLIEKLKTSYDYIICDLPPVNAVADGLVVSKLIDGLVVVVRQRYCDRNALDEAMHRLEILNVNILGFAMTRGDTARKSYKRYGGRYGRYGHYGRYGYYKNYEYRYGDYRSHRTAVVPDENADDDL